MMKNRYFPRWFSLQKVLIASIVCVSLLLISIIVVLIVKNDYLSIILPLPFALATFITTSDYLVETICSKKKYEIKQNKIIVYEPFRNPCEIDINKVNDIYIVVHTTSGYGPILSNMPISDVNDRSRVIYDVILLKEGYPSQLIWKDASSYILERMNLKEYILYDFNYDSESVVCLLEQTRANIYTNEKMYNEMRQDLDFFDYLNRIKLVKLEPLK